MCVQQYHTILKKNCKQVQQTKKNFSNYLQNKNLVKNENPCFDIITGKKFLAATL